MTGPRPPALPRRVRLLLALDRLVQAAVRGWTMLRDELLHATLPPARRDAVADAIFSRQGTYAAGGATFESGLHDWEREMLAREELPRAGRVLVVGAGGGREMQALRAMGYEVVGLEPAAGLAREAAALFDGDPGAVMLRGGFADLVRAVARDPAAPAPRAGDPTAGDPAVTREALACDVVLLGWGSLMHVRTDEERRALFRALRALAPSAPVMLSFDDYPPPDPPGSRLAPVRARVRRLLAAAGAPASARDDERFLPWAGFVRGMSEGELRALAREAGYRVSWLRTLPGHAILLPGVEGESAGADRP